MVVSDITIFRADFVRLTDGEFYITIMPFSGSFHPKIF